MKPSRRLMSLMAILLVGAFPMSLLADSGDQYLEKVAKDLQNPVSHSSDHNLHGLYQKAAAMDLALYLSSFEGERNVAFRQQILEKLSELNSHIDLENAIQNLGRADDAAIDDLLNPGWNAGASGDGAAQGLMRAYEVVGPEGLANASLKSDARGLKMARLMGGSVARSVLGQLIEGARGAAIQDAARSAASLARENARGGRPAILPGGGGGGGNQGGGGGNQGGGPPEDRGRGR